MARNTKLGLAVSLLLGILFLTACGDSSKLIETGPNAGLSNKDLLMKAAANMKVLTSFHIDVTGTYPRAMNGSNFGLNITGDIQSYKKGSRIQASENPTPGATPEPSKHSVDVIMVDDGWYESYDSDLTWQKPRIDTPAYLLIAPTLFIWDRRDSTDYPTAGEQIVAHVTINDAGSTIESIDGATTRHMTALLAGTVDSASSAMTFMQDAKSLDFWVTTDITPTIRQMTITGSNLSRGNETPTATYDPFSLTWKWSRINEDFGQIGAPPAAVTTPEP